MYTCLKQRMDSMATNDGVHTLRLRQMLGMGSGSEVRYILRVCICIITDTIFNFDARVDVDPNSNVTCEQSFIRFEGH